MATLQGAIDQIQGQIMNVSGIRAAPSEPPEKLNMFPFAVCFTRSGIYQIGPPEVMTGLHVICIEVHVARRDLPRDIRAAMVYAKSIPNKVFSALKASSLTAISTLGNIRYEFGPMAYGGQDTLGFRFLLEDVKTQDTIT
jgi:hypothetical protein